MTIAEPMEAEWGRGNDSHPACPLELTVKVHGGGVSTLGRRQMSRWRLSCGLHLSTAFQGSPLHRLTGCCRVFCLPGSLSLEAVTLSMVP